MSNLPPEILRIMQAADSKGKGEGPLPPEIQQLMQAHNKLPPDIQRIMKGVDENARRASPPPTVIRPAPPPEPAAVPVGAPVVDPVSGQPLQRGRPVQNYQPTLGQRAIEGVDTVGKKAQAAMGAVFNPLEQAAEEEVRAGVRGYQQGGLLGAFTAYVRTFENPEAVQRVIASPRAGEIKSVKPSEILQQEGAIGPPKTPVEKWARIAADLASQFLVDEITGFGVGGALKLAGKAVGAAAKATGAADRALPILGKSANQLVQEVKKAGAVKQTFVRGEARGAQRLANVEPYFKDVVETTRKYKAAGLNPAKVDAFGRRVNEFDEFVTHWIEAGGKGAAYPSRQAAEAAARAKGYDPVDLRRIGNGFSRAFTDVGLLLEKHGFLKKGTVQSHGGRYMSRFYHATGGDPADLESALKLYRDLGGVNQSVIDKAERLLRNQAAGFGTGASAGKKRVLKTFRERLAIDPQLQSTKLAARGLPQQTRIAERLESLEEIANNPAWSVPTTRAGGAIPNTRPPGWKLIAPTEKRYGALAGQYVDPTVLKVVERSITAQKASPAWKLVEKAVGPIKAGWVAYNPPTHLNNAVGNYVLAQGAAKARGLDFNVGDVLAGMKDWVRWKKTGQTTPEIEALLKYSRALQPEANQLMQARRGLAGATGIETPLQQAGQAGRSLLEAPKDFYGNSEQVFKVGLMRRYMRNMTPEEAAQAVQKALFDYSDRPAWLDVAERYGAAPFLTFSYKAAPQYLEILLTNPQTLVKFSGAHQKEALIRASGEEARARAPLSKENEFPVPGLKDQYGRQRFVRFNPLSQNYLQQIRIGDEGTFDYRDIGAGMVGGSVLEAVANYDAFRDEPIVKPGEMPPWDGIKKRAEHALEGLVPAITPILGRSAKRIDRAATGTTQYPGPYQEPESVTDAILGAFVGTKTMTPETPLEGYRRGLGNIAKRSANQEFLGQYLMARYRGEVQPQQFPAEWMPKQPKGKDGTEEQYKRATNSLRNYVFGLQAKPGSIEAQATIRRLSDWMYALQQHYQEQTGQRLAIQDAIDTASGY